MKMQFFISLAVTSTLMMGCDSKIEDLESTRPSSNIPVTEVDGVVTGTVSSTATTDQIMVASTSSEIADSAVTFPPGALSISTAIALGQATDRNTVVMTELGITNAVHATAPVYVGPASGTPPVVGQPLTIQLPLPLEESGTSLVADGELSKLVLTYVIYDGGWKSGMIPLTSADLSGAYVKQAMAGMGYFQIVYLTKAAAEKEVTSQVRPGLDGTQTQGGDR
ncbi:MAG TPA: hypothetical protein VE954_06220 [Oligoflexus sp.]|uniref:hypothetical protein n=1 Tax=Oligoflexus sp. TaxID=1971216 RepID=UPI002D5F03FF|nr:hypothetical protein [Oligoflexus sp.]HYX32690.1 hypothetical protein [Oligoflexus sp.]